MATCAVGLRNNYLLESACELLAAYSLAIGKYLNGAS